MNPVWILLFWLWGVYYNEPLWGIIILLYIILELSLDIAISLIGEDDE